MRVRDARVVGLAQAEMKGAVAGVLRPSEWCARAAPWTHGPCGGAGGGKRRVRERRRRTGPCPGDDRQRGSATVALLGEHGIDRGACPLVGAAQRSVGLALDLRGPLPHGGSFAFALFCGVISRCHI